MLTRPRRHAHPLQPAHLSTSALLGAVAFTAALAGSIGTPARLAAQPQAAPAPSPARGLAISAENATAAAEARGGAARNDARARPGDVVHYRLAFTNPVDRPVRGVRIEDAIPAGTHFVAGSAHAARSDAVAEYSADGGRSYAARPVEQVVVDGVATERPVPADRYTHVRWTVRGVVAPRDRIVAEFDTQLAGPTR